MENVETTVKMVNAHRHSRSTTIAAKRQSLISSSRHFSQSQLLASNLLLLFSVLASSYLHVLNFSYALIALTFIHFRIQLSIFEVHLTSNILFSVLVFARTLIFYLQHLRVRRSSEFAAALRTSLVSRHPSSCCESSLRSVRRLQTTRDSSQSLISSCLASSRSTLPVSWRSSSRILDSSRLVRDASSSGSTSARVD